MIINKQRADSRRRVMLILNNKKVMVGIYYI